MPRPRSDIEPRILQAARERFLKEGVDGASLRMIARDAGTSIGMIYYYFPTKDELFLAVVEEAYGALIEGLEAAFKTDVPVQERIERMYERFACMSTEEFEVLLLIVREALVSSTRLGRLLERTQLRHVTMLVSTLAEGVTEGTVAAQRNLLVVAICTFALGIAPQVALRLIGDRLPLPEAPVRQQLPHQLTELLFNGIGGRKPSGSDE